MTAPARAVRREAPRSEKSRPDETERLPPVGPRIRYLRRTHRLRLKDLADAAGCSESLLSRIENGLVMPSLTTLHRICRAVDVSVAALLEAAAEAPCVVYGPENRPRFTLTGVEGDGSGAESMVPFAESRRLEGLIIHLPTAGPLCGPFRHEGEEVGYVLDGELELTVQDRVYWLAAGHSFYFSSDRPHSYRAAGDQPCRVIWVNTPPTF